MSKQIQNAASTAISINNNPSAALALLNSEQTKPEPLALSCQNVLAAFGEVAKDAKEIFDLPVGASFRGFLSHVETVRRESMKNPGEIAEIDRVVFIVQGQNGESMSVESLSKALVGMIKDGLMTKRLYEFKPNRETGEIPTMPCALQVTYMGKKKTRSNMNCPIFDVKVLNLG